MSQLIPCLGLVLAAPLAACSRPSGGGVDPALICAVEQGELVITVRERGEIKAARSTRIASNLEGHAALIYLIPEGTVVTAGERVGDAVAPTRRWTTERSAPALVYPSSGVLRSPGVTPSTLPRPSALALGRAGIRLRPGSSAWTSDPLFERILAVPRAE